MNRRSFIKLTAVSSGTAALASCGNPDHEIIRFVPDEDIVPGIATWKPGVCTLCAAGCGLTVRVMEADADVIQNGQAGRKRIHAAKKLEGAPDHPVNRGGLCARGQAAIQVTYHPDRITQPLKRRGERGAGTYDAISWDDAVAQLVAELDKLEAAGNQRALAFLARPGMSHRAALISQFLAAFGAPAPIVHEPFGDDVLRRANALSFGREQLPTFDLANARFVLGVGADFLGTWNSPVAQAAAYGAMRQARPGVRGTFVQIESRMSQTGANADQWVPATPGTEGVVILAMAHVILREKLAATSSAGRSGALIDGWGAGLPAYAPEEAEKTTGVRAALIERLARDFAAQTPAVAIVGGPPLGYSSGLFTALAVNALNALVGSVERPGGVSFTPQIGGIGGAAAAFRRPEGLASLAAGAPQVVLIDGANPVFTSPAASKVRDAIQAAPFIASFGSFLDETSILADLILPDHSFLETWIDAIPESGAMVATIGVAAPAMAPLYQTRATPDVLIEVAGRLRTPIAPPWKTYEEALAATFATLPPAVEGGDAWTEAQERGGWWGTLPARVASRPPANPPSSAPVSYRAPQFDGEASSYPFQFLPYASSTFLDGSTAHLPWLQELPDPMTSAMWSSWVEINPATAVQLGIGQGDVVEIASTQGSLQTAAVLTPGIAPDVLAMPAGQGHTTFTRYASGRGANPVALLAAVTVEGTGSLAWAGTRVKITRVGGPDGRLVLFGGGDRDHDQMHEYGHSGRG